MKALYPATPVEIKLMEDFVSLPEGTEMTDDQKRYARLVLEDARAELCERARGRGDWQLVHQLMNPTEGSRAERMLARHMRTVADEIC